MSDKNQSKKLILIDGNSLINRAYYAIQRPMMTKDGLYTQGVYGFISMLNKVLEGHEPGYIAVAWDKKAPTFRHKEYKDYKAGRKQMPMELAMQMPVIKDVLEAMNIKMYEIEGYEADDIIGTIAKRGEENELRPLIITGDKDELQLASDKTEVMITKKGISEFDLYDENKMEEKYGFTSKQFIDYKGLMGDQSDNIPGLPGVGEKTAKKLIDQFGSVENLLQNTDEISNEKLRTKIEDNAQLAVMSKRLATIFTDVPLDLNFDEMKYEEPDYNKLIDLYVKLEFNNYLKKLKAKRGDDLPEIKTEKVKAERPTVKSEIITDSGDFPRVEKDLSKERSIYIKVFTDDNHQNIPKIFGISFMTDKNYYYVNVEDDNEMLDRVCGFFKENKVSYCGHDVKRDLYTIATNLKELDLSGYYDFDPQVEFDTTIAQYILDPTRSNYTLKTIVYEYLDHDFTDEKDFVKENVQMDMLSDNTQKFADYGLEWCLTVCSLVPILTKKIEELKLTHILQDIELPLIEPLADMEVVGFAVDMEVFDTVGTDISSKVDTLTKDIHQLAGEDFNINSPAQLGVILFEKLNLPPSKKTKTGYSTNVDVLEKLIDKHPIIEKVLEYRTLTKLKGTYIDGLKPLVHVDGKIHAHFQQTVTATGRISCTEPNLQNIPIRQELGRSIRKAFVPQDDNHVLIGADYSQIELRVLAHLSGDESLINDFNQGADIHKRTASRIFDEPEDKVTPLQRRSAKAVNFGIIYGQSAFGLSEGIGISRKDADKYISDYFKQHKAVKDYLDNSVKEGKEKGYVKTLSGRRRDIPEINASNYNVRQFGERLAMNSPIQGTAADIMKIAMFNVYNRLQEDGYKSKVILQVHDELIIDAATDEADKIEEILKYEMENAYKLKVPLVVEVNRGKNWYELK